MIAGISGDVVDNRRSRSQWMDSVTDLLGAYSDEQATRVASLLVDLALTEGDPECREAALHAVAELVVWHPAVTTQARRLRDMPTERLSPSEQEYLDALCE